jgi:threonine/homoserine/homoserine lactone efflux protein
MQELLTFIVASILITLSPGPDIIMLISYSLQKGFKYSIKFIMGLISGLLIHSLILILGWSNFFSNSEIILFYFKIIGFTYFMYIGIVELYFYLVQNQSTKKSNISKNLFKQGIIMNITNPKVGLFFWLFFPNFLFSSEIIEQIQYSVLCSIFIIQVFIIFSLAAYFSSRVSYLLKVDYLKPINGLILISLSLYIMFS